MKMINRSIALDSYKGARLTLRDQYVYPSYILIKESLKATLLYIANDVSDRELSNKTSLEYLIELLSDDKILQENDVEILNDIALAEKGKQYVDIETLKKTKAILKRLISTYMSEHV